MYGSLASIAEVNDRITPKRSSFSSPYNRPLVRCVPTNEATGRISSTSGEANRWSSTGLTATIQPTEVCESAATATARRMVGWIGELGSLLSKIASGRSTGTSKR